jgi:hypothetical protein
MTERKYLPTLADLVDRLTIVQQKMIFLPDRREEYVEERKLILHDIDLILTETGHRIGAFEIKAICILMLANRYIWEQESKTRDGSSTDPPDIQLHRLRATHSINGVRATAKNMLSSLTGSRSDYKIDCMASDLPEEFGHWDIFGDEKHG